MRISPSKRFEQLEKVIAACRKAAVSDDWDELVRLKNYKFDSLFTAISDDFERLSQEYLAIADKVAEFEQAKIEIEDLSEASLKRIQERLLQA